MGGGGYGVVRVYGVEEWGMGKMGRYGKDRDLGEWRG